LYNVPVIGSVLACSIALLGERCGMYICSTFFHQQRTNQYLSHCQIQFHPRVTFAGVSRRLHHSLFGHLLHPPVYMWTCAKRTHVLFETEVTPFNLTPFFGVCHCHVQCQSDRIQLVHRPHLDSVCVTKVLSDIFLLIYTFLLQLLLKN